MRFAYADPPFDNSRWGALNSKQQAVLAMLDLMDDWHKKVIAQIAVTYATDEVLAALEACNVIPPGSASTLLQYDGTGSGRDI